jgi:N6-L-threonylcarbamoyladenine synthase
MMATRILGIETSCDETAAAVIQDGRWILSNVVATQMDLHAQYGGVFPEMASRQHILSITPVIRQAMAEAQVTWNDLNAIAVVYGPGLPGSLLVGVNVTKGLALGSGLPFIGVNHIEAHILTNWLAANGESPAIEFPLVCLVVSGGHTELVLMRDFGRYERLGSTIDDAAGEAFDKVGRLLGLPYPGGPATEQAAQGGNPTAFSLPRAWLKGTYDFSFSGLKTAVLHVVQKYETQPPEPRPGGTRRRLSSSVTLVRPLPVVNLAASFQAAVVDVLAEKTGQAAREFEARCVLLAGGVAANQALRHSVCERVKVPVYYPPLALCTDNATGVGVAGYHALRAGRLSNWDLDVVPGLRLT